MIKTICLRAYSDCKRFIHYENEDAQGIIVCSEIVRDTPGVFIARTPDAICLTRACDRHRGLMARWFAGL